MKTLVYSLLVFVTITPALCAAESEEHVFVSEVHGFSMQYPKTWNKGETVHPQTVIRVESPDGDDYNIGVALLDPALRSKSPQEFAQGMLEGADYMVTNVLSKNYPDAHLVKKGLTTLSQQSALFYIMDYTLSAAGRKIPMRAYTIMTKRKDKQYTLTFRTPQVFFDKYMPTIQRLALGFQFTNTKRE